MKNVEGPTQRSEKRKIYNLLWWGLHFAINLYNTTVAYKITEDGHCRLRLADSELNHRAESSATNCQRNVLNRL